MKVLRSFSPFNAVDYHLQRMYIPKKDAIKTGKDFERMGRQVIIKEADSYSDKDLWNVWVKIA